MKTSIEQSKAKVSHQQKHQNSASEKQKGGVTKVKKIAKKWRLEARVSREAEKTIKRAAELQGRTITDFVVSAAIQTAQKAIEDAELIRLTIEDQEAFANALLSPPPDVSEALRRASEKHSELFMTKE